MKSPYREVIEKEAAKAGVDPLLVEAIIQQESSGRADAFRYEPEFFLRYMAGDPAWHGQEPRRVSSSYGLMQLMYTTAVTLGFRQAPEGLFDIQVNISLGCTLLASLLRRFSNDVEKALAAYNGGPAGIGRPGPLAYARSVQDRYVRLQATRGEGVDFQG